MHRTNRFVPGVAALALVLALAACSQAADPSPSTPSTTPEPSQPTSPAPSPSDAPSESPTIEVVEHELPMIGRVTTDDTDVHALPSLDAPLAEGERLSDLERVDVTLAAGDRVQVDVGPLYSDGLSWYRVAAADGSDVQFAFGWVPGDVLEREDDYPEGFGRVSAVYGLGSGTADSVDIPNVGTPVTVAFAAAPMPGDDSCEAEVTLIRTDGAAVNVATEMPTEAMTFEVGADTHGGGMTSLFQEEAGEITLQVRSDCAFAASTITPAE